MYKQKEYSAFCNSFNYRAVDIDTGWIKDARKKGLILMWWIKGLLRYISEVSKVQRQLSSC